MGQSLQTDETPEDIVRNVLSDADMSALALGSVALRGTRARLTHRQRTAVRFTPERIPDRLGLPGDVDEQAGSFEIVLSAGWHERAEFFRWSLQELVRVLRPGGVAVILLPTINGDPVSLPTDRASRGPLSVRTLRRALTGRRPEPTRVPNIVSAMEEIGLEVMEQFALSGESTRQGTRVDTGYLTAHVPRVGQDAVTMFICSRRDTIWSRNPLLADRAKLESVFRKNYESEMARLASFQAAHGDLLSEQEASDPIGEIGCALVLSPHPDDELIGAGGTLLRLRERGIPFHVLQMTNGRGCASLATMPEPLRRSIRLEEAGKVSEGLGASMTAWDDLDDDIPSDADLTDRLLDLLDRVRPDTILVPFLNDPHPDHLFANRVLRAALEREPETSVKRILSYEVWTLCPHNLIVDTTTVAHRKTELLGHYRTALRVVNYARTSEWFSAWHAHRSLGHKGMAEAFLSQSVAGYLVLAGRIPGVGH